MREKARLTLVSPVTIPEGGAHGERIPFRFLRKRWRFLPIGVLSFCLKKTVILDVVIRRRAAGLENPFLRWRTDKPKDRGGRGARAHGRPLRLKGEADGGFFASCELRGGFMVRAVLL